MGKRKINTIKREHFQSKNQPKRTRGLSCCFNIATTKEKEKSMLCRTSGLRLIFETFELPVRSTFRIYFNACLGCALVKAHSLFNLLSAMVGHDGAREIRSRMKIQCAQNFRLVRKSFPSTKFF